MPKTHKVFARGFGFRVPCNWFWPEKLALFHFFCFLFSSNFYFLLKECDFTKRRSDTYLRVVYMGNTRIMSCRYCCKRWYFTFNDAECRAPASIDGIVYHDSDISIHRSANIEGYCGGIIQGKVRVGFHVGNCKAHDVQADAHTSWNAISRIIVEEVEPPVS